MNANVSRKDNKLRRGDNKFLKREKESKKSRNRKMNLELLIRPRDKLKEMLVERSRSRAKRTTKMERKEKLLHLLRKKSKRSNMLTRKRMRIKMVRTSKKSLRRVMRMLKTTKKSLEMKMQMLLLKTRRRPLVQSSKVLLEMLL